MTLLLPEREEFHGAHLAIALGWCLVWMMGTAGELGIEGFAGKCFGCPFRHALSPI